MNNDNSILINQDSNDNKSIREKFLLQGTELIKNELISQIDYLTDTQKKTELKNIEILSDNLVASEHINSEIKNKVLDYSANVEKIIYATAFYIEEDQYKSIDDKIAKLDLSKFDKNRIENLILAQKKLSGSFQTLTVVIDVFKQINEDILDQINDASAANESNNQLKLYFKNAVLVYELTNFAANFLNKFGLQGIDDFKTIRKEVFEDLEQGERKDLELEKSLDEAPESLRLNTLDDINYRKEARTKVKERWKKIGQEISKLNERAKEAQKLVAHLEIIRQNAANQIDVLNLIATTKVVESTISAIKGVADISNFRLAPLDGNRACELLGINI
ncbi:hypothetical protein [Desulfonatronovibrio magnus]|uniref:hypothetical protein n=1 Tax=Desulfonatronovibrio magnus TaxID=698827 RepID=UPI0005EADF4F|nr:hypothetical protein [Desulfonatronovibrio magnus]